MHDGQQKHHFTAAETRFQPHQHTLHISAPIQTQHQTRNHTIAKWQAPQGYLIQLQAGPPVLIGSLAPTNFNSTFHSAHRKK
jgi:hypothetical protein